MSNARKTRPPSYRRHKASGQAVVTFHGRDHYLGRHGSDVSKNEYDRLIAEYLANGRRMELPDPQSPSSTVLGEHHHQRSPRPVLSRFSLSNSILSRRPSNAYEALPSSGTCRTS